MRNRPIEILDRAFHVAFKHPSGAKPLISPRHVWRQLNRTFEIDDCAVEILQAEIDIAALVERPGHFVVELNRPVEIGQRALVVTQVETQTAAITECLRQVLIKRDCTIEIFYSRGRISLSAVHGGAIQIRDRQRWTDANRLVQIGECSFQITLFVTSKAAIAVGIRNKRINNDDIVVA